MNSFTIKIVAFVLSVFIILIFVSQGYRLLTDKQKSEQAIFYTYSDSIAFKGVFIRNEDIIQYDGQGVLNFVYTDGSKVSKDSIVAEAYSSISQINAISEKSVLNTELYQLNKATNPGISETAQPEFIANEIDNEYIALQKYIQENNTGKISETKTKLLSLMNIYNIITDEESIEVFNQRVNQINSRINELNGIISSPLSTIKTDAPGYFVSYCDGYEDKLNFANINEITEQQINSIVMNPDINESSQNIGKVIDGYTWKAAGIISTDSRCKADSYINIRLNKSSDLLSAKIESVDNYEDNKSRIIISCNQINYDLVQDRVADIEIIIKEQSGIKISRKALNFENGVRGVYVMYGQNIVFKKINVVYEGEDFILSSPDEDSDYVMIYDKIIFEEDEPLGNNST